MGLYDAAYLQTMADGTIKQANPFTGTRVWTAPGRGNRPLAKPPTNVRPLEDGEGERACAFCSSRYLETPPEKSRIVRDGDGWREIEHVEPEDLFKTTAEFRVIPNLFEILSYDYWHANYGYELPASAAEARSRYLESPAGWDHVVALQRTKMAASGMAPESLAATSDDAVVGQATSFFGSGHDVVVARRHWIDDAVDSSALASSGTLTPDEHNQYISLAVADMERLYQLNPYARYVAVFQNWLKPAGASFDHLHKQLVTIDEHGSNLTRTTEKLRANPNLFNEAGVNYANRHNLVIAENEHAIAMAGIGHRYPTISVNSKSREPRPWRQSDDEVRGMSDLIHAIHAAIGSSVPCNEEWHHQPIDVDVRAPWRINIKLRVSTVAGFEGGTKIYINTISPTDIRDNVVPRLFELRAQGAIAPMNIAMECSREPNLLLYNPTLW
ncbi:MAG: DUF4921 family protein [Propionibacteriaceae bacterium]|nr:DUF4921 family protein [Propionibacteriaceae bacterium]